MNHILQIAERHLGLKEWPGAKHNPEIVAMFEATGNGWVKDDETPWCAAFVGSVLAEAGVAGTNKLNARSYLNWGVPVALDDALPGDIVVLWRGKRDGWQGHVAFYSGRKGNDLLLLGGNQGNAVSVAAYPKSRVLGVRRMKMPKTPVTSTTMQAAAVTAISGAGGVATAIGALDGTAQIVLIVLAFIGLAGVVWIMRERLKKMARGI